MIVLITGVTMALTGCGGVPSVQVLRQAQAQRETRFLTGAGSTFDYPFFSRAFYDYNQQQHIEVNYQPIGSGGGILQLIQGTVSFGATDVPMDPSELARAKRSGGPVLQLPVTLGAEAIAYNLPGVRVRLRFTPDLLATIFLGQVTRWNSLAIAQANPGVVLPNLPILVVHRSDSSGTTYIFTDYLSHVSARWASQVGTGKAVDWPVGVGGKGNTAVAQMVQTTPGAIGYVELAYVLQSRLAYGMVQNAAGRFVIPSLAGATAAASALPDLSARHYSIVNAPGVNSYPISGYSWVVVYEHQKNMATAQALHRMLRWLIGAEQQTAHTVGNAPLPANAQALALRELATLRG